MTHIGDVAVRLDGARKTYGEVVAVDRVDLDIREDEFFTFLGPSGSGKTTCLRMIAGFERPDEGRVELGGRDVTDLPPYERHVNTVFQDYALFPHMTVGENVEYGLRIAKVGKEDRRRRATWMTFRRVVMPLALPAVVAGSIFTFSLTLGDYIAPTLVSSTQFIGNVVYANVGIANNLPLAAAFATVPVAIMIIYLLIARRLGAFESL